jgi:xanthine dehydrogenase large subunit
MGQGLNTKVAQVVAHEFQIDFGSVKITATNTGKVPNTSATAASSGSDMNGMAAQAAARTIKSRMREFLAEQHQCMPESVSFTNGEVRAGAAQMPFAEAVKACYMGRVSLSATGFYATPKIHWDKARSRGRPFYYYAYGAAVTEIATDLLTGENRILRSDILHDVGRSLNPAIDIGQIEGGFVQGAGWLTTEELVWDEQGRLRTHAPSTYKIPACADRPPVFNVALFDDGENVEDTIHKSKAVGEPPLMLAISVLMALSHALESVSCDYPMLDAPATPERLCLAARRLGGPGITLPGTTAGDR